MALEPLEVVNTPLEGSERPQDVEVHLALVERSVANEPEGGATQPAAERAEHGGRRRIGTPAHALAHGLERVARGAEIGGGKRFETPPHVERDRKSVV